MTPRHDPDLDDDERLGRLLQQVGPRADAGWPERLDALEWSARPELARRAARAHRGTVPGRVGPARPGLRWRTISALAAAAAVLAWVVGDDGAAVPQPETRPEIDRTTVSLVAAMVDVPPAAVAGAFGAPPSAAELLASVAPGSR